MQPLSQRGQERVLLTPCALIVFLLRRMKFFTFFLHGSELLIIFALEI